MTLRAALLLAAGLLAGCDSSTRTIYGTISTTYQTPHGSTDVPVDFTTTMVAALVAGDSGVDYQVYAAHGASDGTFEIRDVPIGDYVLQVGSAYYVTDVDTFTLHTPAFGHPNAIPDMSSAGLAVTAGNLAPWSDGEFGAPDELEAYSGDANAWQFATHPGEIESGATELTGLVFINDVGVGSSPLLDGDDFAVEQLQSGTGESVSYYSLARLYSTGPVTQTAGMITPVGDAQAMFVDETANVQTLTQPVDEMGFATETGYSNPHYTLVNPAAVSCGFSGEPTDLAISIGGQPGDGSLGLTGGGADYLLLTLPVDAFAADLTGIPYPLPTVMGETWTPYYAIQLEVCIPLGPDGQLVPFPALATIGPVDKLPAMIAPGIGVVRTPVIASAGTNIAAGLDVFQPQDYVGTVPTIAWVPPNLGTPTTYAVQIFDITSDAATSIATIFTHVETVTLPPGLFEHGRHYAIAIAASDAPFPGTPVAPDEAHSASVVVSALLTP